MKTQIKKFEDKPDKADDLKFEKILLLLKEILVELQAIRNRFV